MDLFCPSCEKPASAHDAAYWTRFDRMLKRIQSESCLRRLLQQVQRRLGTPTEHSRDLRRAREIAHRLDNLMTAINLQAQLQELRAKGQLPPAKPRP